VVNVAEAEVVYVVNTSSDMSKYGPKSSLAAVTNDWGAYFIEQVGAHLGGTFKGNDFHGGLNSCAVKVVVWSKDLSADQMAKIKEADAKLTSGELHAFAGPMLDQSGKEGVAAGSNLADGDIFGMNWLVKGVTGSLPN
jgi:basic membrane protein A